jgi:hypothetical protein
MIIRLLKTYAQKGGTAPPEKTVARVQAGWLQQWPNVPRTRHSTIVTLPIVVVPQFLSNCTNAAAPLA